MSYLGQMYEKLIDQLRPMKPYDFLRAQVPSFTHLLPYETVLDLERPTVLLSDGSLGVVWELTPFSHETLPHEELERLCGSIGRILGDIKHPEAALQVIFDSEPSETFDLPAYAGSPETSAQKILVDRIQAVQALAKKPREKLRLMRRRVFLTLRLGRSQGFNHMVDEGSKGVSPRLAQLSRDIDALSRDLEYGLSHAGIAYRVLDGTDFLYLLRCTIHDSAYGQLTDKRPVHPRRGRLSSQALQGFVKLTPHGVGVGGDTWEVASWADQPPTVYPGMLARLLELDIPLRLVLNVRPCFEKSDLDRKSFLLRRAEDPAGELQRSEVRDTMDALARGESLVYTSLHLLVRNVEVSPQELELKSGTLELLAKVKTLTQIPWILEKYAAPALFLFALPLGFSKTAASFSGREKRVLSRNLGPYVPLYGAFTGTRKPLQLMVSRGGSAAWLSPLASETSAHMAVLASSGGGKSFFAQNLMMSFIAQYKDPLIFIIDKKTSYEIFAKVVGEDHGYQLLKPPAEYPNIFRGPLDAYRLPVIVGLLKSAISLVSKNLVLGAVEEMLLSDAVRLAFEQNELDAQTAYQGGSLQEIIAAQVKIPRLSDVRNNLFTVAGTSGVSPAVVAPLAESLTPFVGQGPYAALFDREEFDLADPATPGVSLYDIDAVASHPLLSTLTTQMILSEILRQICRPENRGRPGMLVIEEAGVLAGSSPEIVAFIQDSWKTFRKLGIICVGLTNEVDDYRVKPGPREIWNISPNKIILKMLVKDIEKAGSREGELAPLIDDAHLINLIGSLTKKDGVYSQGLFLSDETKGTFVYSPTGYDYWCAASKPLEVATVYRIADAFQKEEKPFFEAVSWLAQNFPGGVRDAKGDLRELQNEDLLGTGGASL
jgi:hypothetical protein